MKILVSIYLKNKQNSQYANSFVSFLNILSDDIALLISGQKDFPTAKLTNTDINKFIPDIIIAFNRGGLRKVKKLNMNWNAPVIYSFCNSDFVKEYNGTWDQWDNLIIIDDDNNITKKNFPDGLTTFLKLPNLTNEIISYVGDKKNITIQIEFNGPIQPFSLLLGIAPVINSLTHLKFLVSGNEDESYGHFNSNVQFNSTILQTDIVDLVIGSGKAIEKAIVNFKPCIVVGTRGYGGLLTKLNFEKQYASGFQGRIGGEIGEYIPEKILMEEILDFLEMEQKQVNEITKNNNELMQKAYMHTTKQLAQMLTKIIKDYKTIHENLLSIKLKFAPLFMLIPINDKQFMIQKSGTNKFNSMVDFEEYKVVHEFANGNPVNDVMVRCGYDNDPESFLEFIRELLNEKILVLSE